MKLIPLALVLLLLAACCNCPPATKVTPKPSIVPVQRSNKVVKKTVHQIKESSQEELKINKDLQGDLNSATNELDKLLRK